MTLASNAIRAGSGVDFVGSEWWWRTPAEVLLKIAKLATQRFMIENAGLITISSILRLPPLLCDARMHPACDGLESALIDAFVHVVPLILDSLPEIASS